MRFDEISQIKPLNPEQARLKSMKDRVKRDQAAVKAERARQQIKAGQQKMRDVIQEK
jgi:outer membrane murein-binding lipoprotein Lpp